jgi:isopenicillin N synthase-like dioxygenase
MSLPPDDGGGAYDRLNAVKEFDASKIGVKGLVDSGLITIPKFFVHEKVTDLPDGDSSDADVIPTIDLGVDRVSLVDQISRASRELGFFQIVNHGIPTEVLDRMVESIKGFHEQPAEVKARFYRRDYGHGVSFISNIDLFHSKAASWRDTLQVKLGPKCAEPDEIPEICRNEAIKWNSYVKQLSEHLMELLCEGLGVSSGRLKEMTFSEGRLMVGHYYPPCPQPDLTIGITSHTDPGVLTVLLQDHIGGLQVKHGGKWLNVKPVRGALVINIADLLQILSNDEYVSVEHRVVANSSNEPRISVGVFFNSAEREKLCGPFPELISPEKPAVYGKFTNADYMKRFFTKELDGKSLTNYYKL